MLVVTGPPSADDVLQLLRGVIDPELGGNVVDLGMVPEVAVSPDGDVRVVVKLTIAGCPLRTQIKNDVEVSQVQGFAMALDAGTRR